MTTMPRRRSLLLAVALLVGACQGQAPSIQPQPIASVSPTERPAPAVTPRPSREPSPAASPTPNEDLTERPFTVLLLGADHEGRTDTIMVVGVDVPRKTMSIASIPRDTVNVPLPGGGTYTNQKINAFWNHAAASADRYPDGPGPATVDLVGLLLDIEIDFYARTTFGGFTALADAMGGVEITLPKALSDPYYQITIKQVGIRFPAGAQRLDGDRALMFVRTRKADNDFERQRRQQAFLLAAGRQLLADPGLLAGLLAAQRNLQSDFPLAQAPALLLAIGDVDTWTINQAVLGPTRYETATSCPCGYALAPKLDEFAKLGALYYPWAVRR
ncbi:MAG TPA: LCP family protein [Candidatus Limnocylindrales bacterium]|nr:LCP family protein [Candidatus Limnocylindrales bacterium]